MTLDELRLLKDMIQLADLQSRKECEDHDKALQIIDREINLKLINVNKND